MSQADREYESKMLRMIINTYLDKTVLITGEGFKWLEANLDQIVWDLATKIYSQSGHKVEFSIVRDEVNFRIGVMKAQLEAEAASRFAKEKVAQLKAAHRVAERKARLRTQMPHILDQMLHILEEFAGDEDKVRVFARVRQIVSEELSVDENDINLNSDLYLLGPGEFDMIEIMALQ